MNSLLLLTKGPPYVRAIGPTKAVAETDLIIHCPFSGYPIESIRWERAGQEIITSKCGMCVFFPSLFTRLPF